MCVFILYLSAAHLSVFVSMISLMYRSHWEELADDKQD